MAAKVKHERGAWWVFTHHAGHRKKKRFGSRAEDQRDAEKYAKSVNDAIARRRIVAAEPLGTRLGAPIPCDEELRRWHEAWSPTFKHSYEYEARKTIEVHLVPFFGSTDLRDLTEEDLLRYIGAKLAEDYATKTIENHLTVLRRVLSLLVKKGRLASNPAAEIKSLMRRVQRRTDKQTREIDTWTIAEVQTLLAVARQHRARFAPLLATLFYTGMRKGEVLGLKWEDVDFERSEIHVRRSYVRHRITTPKSGRSRRIAMAPELVELLKEVQRDRRKETLKRGWRKVPEWVFPSTAGTPIGDRNVLRTWAEVRKRARARGVRSLTLHCTRHTWASFAIDAGKSIKWIADQLGHRDVSMTLNTYSHLIPNQEQDLSFLNFGTAVEGRACAGIRKLHRQ